MRMLLLLLLLMVITTNLTAQNDTFHILQINQGRLYLTQIHASILGIWAIANITISGYLTWKLYDGEPESFHHMNAAFNLVNFGIAWAMLYNVNHADPTVYDVAVTVAKQYHAQKLLMLNIGLDVSYALTGLWMYEHSKNVQKFDFMWSGFGKSLILQGAFLLVLDTTFSILHASHNLDLQQVLQHLSLKANGIGLQFYF